MELNAKLTSLTRENTAQELNVMFQSTHQISISWWGERLVSIEGYNGVVTINELASKYLKSDSLRADQDLSLKDRLDSRNLWETIEQIYKESDTELNSTWIYKYLVPLLEFRIGCRCCSGDPRAKIETNITGGKENLLAFTFDRYNELWGEPSDQVPSAGLEDSKRYYATKEMVEAKVKG